MESRFEVVIVGMGPAGMAAAVEMAELGIQAAVLDENPKEGGQVYRQPSDDFIVTDTGFLGPKYKTGQKIIGAFNSIQDKLTVFHDTNIWGFFDGTTLSLVEKGEIKLMTYDKLLLTEGAMERSIPFPGWTLPGIMTLGGLQRMVVHERLLPGKRFLLAGCSPLLMPVAASLLDVGAEIVALCDTVTSKAQMKLIPQLMRQKSLAREAAAYFFPVLRRSIPTFRPYAVSAASGENRVQEVVISKLDKNWTPIHGSEIKFEVDAVGLSYGFLPSARLARLCGCAHVFDSIQNYWKPSTDAVMRTNVPHIYVAGDSAGIGGADLAQVEGRIAANHIAAELDKLSDRDLKTRLNSLHKIRNRIKGYTSALNKIFSLKPGLYSLVNEKTIVCRCEHVTAEEVLSGIELGYRNINEIKRTRVGMGLCQGRTCESVIAQLMLQKGIPIEEIGYMGLRPPLSPMPLAVFESWPESIDGVR